MLGYRAVLSFSFTDTKMSFSDNLKEARKKLGVSLEDISGATGYSGYALENFESGRSWPRMNDPRFFHLCNFLCLDYRINSYLCNKERSAIRLPSEEDSSLFQQIRSIRYTDEAAPRIARRMRQSSIRSVQPNLPKPTEDIYPPIFISHASNDGEVACVLSDLIAYSFQLKDNELICTSAEGRGLERTDNYYKLIEKNIKNAKSVIYIISSNFTKSEDCLYELAWGHHLHDERKYFFYVGDVHELKKPLLISYTTLHPINSATSETFKSYLIKQLDKKPSPKTWDRESAKFVKVCPTGIKVSSNYESKTKDSLNYCTTIPNSDNHVSIEFGSLLPKN